MFTKPFVLVTTAALALFIYIGVMVPLLPRLIEEQLGGNEIDIGLNLAVFSIAAVLIRPRLGRFAEQHGLRSTMVGGALLAAAATSLCALIDSRWGLLPLRCLQGIGEAAVFVGAATSISDLAPPGRGAEAASYFSVAVFGGLGIGPVIGESVIGRDRFDAGLLTAAAFAALASALAMLTPAGIRHHDDDGERGPRFHRAAIPTGSGAGARRRWFRDLHRVHARVLGVRRVERFEVGVRHVRRGLPGHPHRRGDGARPHRSRPRRDDRAQLHARRVGDAVPLPVASRSLRQHGDRRDRHLVPVPLVDGDGRSTRCPSTSGCGRSRRSRCSSRSARQGAR